MKSGPMLLSVFVALAIAFVFAAPAHRPILAETQSGPAFVPICDLLRTPDKFDKQTIQLQGNVVLEFEQFSLYSKDCANESPGIWLEFGGDVATPTMSTANDTVRKPGFAPTVGDAPVYLNKDDNFERFFALISARKAHDWQDHSALYNVSATLTGIFLAGNRNLMNGKFRFPGYGHMGFSYLFMITRVDAVNSTPPPHLGVSGTVHDPEGRPLAGVDVYSQTVNCCQPWVSRARSDEAGSFSVRNAGQVLTFLKAGYRPKSIVFEMGRDDAGVTLESMPADDWKIPTCKEPGSEDHFEGLPLDLANPQGMHVEKVSNKFESLFVIRHKPSSELLRILKSKASAPYGETASRIFGSDSFTQRNVAGANEKRIGMDSSGSQSKERWWRITALPGLETMEYDVASPEAAKVFDGVIDSACVKAH